MALRTALRIKTPNTSDQDVSISPTEGGAGIYITDNKTGQRKFVTVTGLATIASSDSTELHYTDCVDDAPGQQRYSGVLELTRPDRLEVPAEWAETFDQGFSEGYKDSLEA